MISHVTNMINTKNMRLIITNVLIGGITELLRPGFSKACLSLSIKLGFKTTDLG